MSDQRDKAVTAVNVRVWQGDDFLMLHRLETQFRKIPEWAPVSGQVESGETPEFTAVRELLAEVGVIAEEEDLQHVHTQYRPGYALRDAREDARIDLYFDLYRFKGEVENREPHVHDRLKWFNPLQLPFDTMPHIREAFYAIARGQRYSELDFAWLRRHGYVKAEKEEA